MQRLLHGQGLLPIWKGIKMNTFEKLYPIDVNEHKEDKQNGCSYLSWTWAWAEVKKAYPDAVYSIKRFENNLPYVYDEKTGYMVFTDVTIDGVTHEMWLPVMDNMNKAMKAAPYKYQTKFGKEMWVKAADMFDINKTIMRCLTKNLAMFGLGLYIYAGEDLPEDMEEEPQKPKKAKEKEPEKEKEPKEEQPKVASAQQIQMIKQISGRIGQPIERICEKVGVKALEDLTPAQATDIIDKLKGARK